MAEMLTSEGATKVAPARPLLGRILSTFEIFAGIVVFLMMILTGIDVFGRYLFGQSVRGSVELLQIMMAISIFAALPNLTFRDEHITVDLLPLAGGRFAWLHQALLFLTCGVLMLTLLPSFWKLSLRAFEWSDKTDFLGIPTGYVQLFMTVMVAVSALAALTRALHLLLTGCKPPEGNLT